MASWRARGEGSSDQDAVLYCSDQLCCAVTLCCTVLFCCVVLCRQQVLRRDGILTGRGVGSSAQDGLRGRWGKGVFAILHGRAKLLAKHAQGGREGLGERHVTGSLGRRRGIRGRGARADRGGQSGRLMWQRMRRREARADRGGQSGRLRRQQGLRRRAQGAWAYRETSDSQWQQMAVAQELNVAYGKSETCRRLIS